MTETFTARFEEYEYYDPLSDSESVRLMCITNIGTWYADVAIEGAKTLRAKREAFKQYVFSALSSGSIPGEVRIG